MVSKKYEPLEAAYQQSLEKAERRQETVRDFRTSSKEQFVRTHDEKPKVDRNSLEEKKSTRVDQSIDQDRKNIEPQRPGDRIQDELVKKYESREKFKKEQKDRETAYMEKLKTTDPKEHHKRTWDKLNHQQRLDYARNSGKTENSEHKGQGENKWSRALSDKGIKSPNNGRDDKTGHEPPSRGR